MTFTIPEVAVIAMVAFALGCWCRAMDECRRNRKAPPYDASVLYLTADKIEINRQKYASYTDKDLMSCINDEREWQAKGFDPTTLDLRKRGCDPNISSQIIAWYQGELDRRKSEAIK